MSGGFLSGGFLSYNQNKKPLQALDFSLFTPVNSESQTFYIIESIIEIKQILQMNGSKTWLEGNWSKHEVSSNYFQIS